MAERSVNDGGFAVTKLQDDQIPVEQARAIQKRKRKRMQAETNARMRVGGNRFIRSPMAGQEPRMGIPEDQNRDGEIDARFQGGPVATNGDPGGGWRGNGSNGSGNMQDKFVAPGDTDGDDVIDNEAKFFGAQKRAVGKAFGKVAHRRNPEGDFTPDREFPTASDGDSLPGKSQMNTPGTEPTTSADQKDAAAQNSKSRQAAKKGTQAAKNSLSSVVQTATNRPLLVGGAALGLLVLLAL